MPFILCACLNKLTINNCTFDTGFALKIGIKNNPSNLILRGETSIGIIQVEPETRLNKVTLPFLL